MAVPTHGSDTPRAWVAGLLTRRMLIDHGRLAAARCRRGHHPGVARPALGLWDWRWAFTIWSPVGNHSVTARRRHAEKV